MAIHSKCNHLALENITRLLRNCVLMSLSKYMPYMLTWLHVNTFVLHSKTKRQIKNTPVGVFFMAEQNLKSMIGSLIK